ncbi:MAG: YitT family protein [Nitriliruptorales bacterium]
MPEVTLTPVPLRRRLAQLVCGLSVMGLGVAMLLAADLGAAPWDVLHQGIARRTSLSVGTTVIVVGLLVFMAWIPLRLRPRLGTILNAFLVGPMVDLGLTLLPHAPGLPIRITYLLLGTLLFGLGAGCYIAAGLGPGPRDGLMTGLAERGIPVRWVRTGLEVGALAVGWALGGTVGVGTLLVALTLGHIIQPVLEKAVPRPPPVSPRPSGMAGALVGPEEAAAAR